jgi:hypothetical protein
MCQFDWLFSAAGSHNLTASFLPLLALIYSCLSVEEEKTKKRRRGKKSSPKGGEPKGKESKEREKKCFGDDDGRGRERR